MDRLPRRCSSIQNNPSVSMSNGWSTSACAKLKTDTVTADPRPMDTSATKTTVGYRRSERTAYRVSRTRSDTPARLPAWCSSPERWRPTAGRGSRLTSSCRINTACVSRSATVRTDEPDAPHPPHVAPGLLEHRHHILAVPMPDTSGQDPEHGPIHQAGLREIASHVSAVAPGGSQRSRVGPSAR